MTRDDVFAAQRRLAPWVHRTPVHTSRLLDRESGRELFFKCENLQRAGAFKFRGATHALLCLDEIARSRGVVTHSSGNHAGALALAGQLLQVPVHVVMPTSAPRVKVTAVREYGATISFCEPTLQAREETTRRILDESGGTLIHPYDDERIIAGQGTAALELLEQVPNLDAMLVPVGGGGLLGGTLLAVQGAVPEPRVIACEPEAANDAYLGWTSGERQPAPSGTTIADGLRTALGERNFPLMREYVHAVVTVSETGIEEAWRLLLERTKLLVEPSSAVPLGSLLEQPDAIPGKRLGIILSGGNVDLSPRR
ncbi:Phenylserine dehydratase [Planctomycetes bacterium Pan216]|uniref:Phenylserine dehydratase n=1 Tax=Kolteria novifilia TaxID=2527975 RepID=A0A518B9G2_9BACT|nr:Phenylserine dehydratase [Planctomycetes bacterium Pan216]